MSTYQDQITGETVEAVQLTEKMVTRSPDGGIFPAEPGNWLVTHAPSGVQNVVSAGAFVAQYVPIGGIETGQSPPPAIEALPISTTGLLEEEPTPDIPDTALAEDAGNTDPALPAVSLPAPAPPSAAVPLASEQSASGPMVTSDATTGGFLGG